MATLHSTIFCAFGAGRTSTTRPAAAVIQRPRALSGFIGRKARVGGFLSPMLNLRAQP